MPLDAVFLSAVTAEVRTALQGGRIDRITQPGRDEIILAFRGQSGHHRLLLTANPSHPRLQLTTLNRENPLQPPMFCMLLRKHLTGARLLSVEQPSMERVVRLTLEALNELGDRVERSLVLECMGRRSNLILLDEEGRIIDCIRRVDAEMSPLRQVLPGLFYHLPPAQEGKSNPLLMEEAAILTLLEAAPPEAEVTALLLESFIGLSPLICRELACRAGGDTSVRLHQLGEGGLVRLAALLAEFFDRIRREDFSPILLSREGKPRDYTYTPILQYGTAMEVTPQAGFSALLEQYYARQESDERVRQIGQGLLKTLTNLRDRTARRVNNQLRELEKALDRELLRQQGDLITSNLHLMQKGQTSLTTANYYDPDYASITIRLDPLLTPQQNAARYYKEYNKAKTAQQVLQVQIQKGEAELEYLESVLQSVRMMEGERDLLGIREELEITGYLSKKNPRGKKVRNSGNAGPRVFQSSAGLQILVGRNNLQNERLTFKTARSGDYWLHAQKYHGSHVLLCTQGEEPDAQSLTEAAQLAAFYSQARDGQNVPVDYTPVRNIKKRPNANPGMVIYHRYSTMFVTPDAALAQQLRQKR